jgi:hypothetical protein
MPSFRSTLLKDGAVQGGSFSSVSHVGHYAGLAQKSMDRFVSAITPFRSTSGGARASGLRPPSTTRYDEFSEWDLLSSSVDSYLIISLLQVWLRSFLCNLKMYSLLTFIILICGVQVPHN